MRLRLATLSIGCCLLTVGDPLAGSVTGIVRTQAREGTLPAPAIVYAEPLDGPAPRAPRRFTLVQKNKTFQPRVLAVPLGSTVDFPNNDPIHHNVFSLSGSQPFDLGLYRAGDSRSRTFTSPGVYRVFCNIHPQMSAIIVVAPTGYTTVAATDGRFMLDLPPGRYRLTAVSERSSAVSAEMTSTQGAATAPDLTLDESAWTFAPHKNKFGADYPAAAYSR
ncbi:MAG TPA: plastocyanin/azurin family copper-binding protein [Vicinamibacterales bacterium]|nr:plastocyanin/azurin family copper-binding protein [Vicinamibacterales bacterium]